MSTESGTLAPGDVQFFDNQVPSLPAGDYRISATLALDNAATGNFQQTYTQDFTVAGPRFTLPPDLVASVFPAASANGPFSQDLPFLLLESPTLPWERSAGTNATCNAVPAPWVALLVLQADEVVINPETHSPLLQGTVRELLTPVDGVYVPAIDPASLPREVLDSQAQSILVPVDVFTQVTPRQCEVAYLAHVREVDPEDQASDGNSLPSRFSVVIANRFPQSSASDAPAGATNYVHLVSLEGLWDKLVDAPSWPDGTRQVRLISLASWSFVSVEQPGMTFAELAENLVAQEGDDPGNLLLRLPVPQGTPQSEASERLGQGYTAFTYHTATGPDTFAWFRGPLTAAKPQPLPQPAGEHWAQSSSVTIYDPNYGVFDHSYSAAWQQGRLLALADPDFTAALGQQKRSLQRTAGRMLERSRLAPLKGVEDLRELARPGTTRRLFEQRVQEGLGSRLTQSLKSVKAAPTAPAPRAKRRPTEGLDARARRDFLQGEDVRQVLTGRFVQDSAALEVWFGRLMLLYGVPFNHLVPDQRMLPVESLRFFYVDPGWLQALHDGALSTAVNHGHDADTVSLMRDALRPRVAPAAHNVRRRMLRKPELAATDTSATPPAAGMLLRSALVSGWPSLAVNATAGGTPVNILRSDRLSPTVLLVLWDRVPDTVRISEPQQGLAFGVEDGNVSVLRSLDPATLGQQLERFPMSGDYSQFMRPTTGDTGGRVLQVYTPEGSYTSWLVPGLIHALKLPTGSTLSPSDLAIELVRSPEMIQFNPPT